MKRVGNYSVIKEENRMVLNYHRSSKDWFDIVIAIAQLVFFSFSTYLIGNQFLKEVNWWLIALFIAFSLVTIYKLVVVTAKVISPLKRVLVIDKSQNTVELRKSLLSSIKLNFNEVTKIQLSGRIEKVVTMRTAPPTRFFCVINFFGRNSEVKGVLLINTNSVISVDGKVIQVEIYSIGKKISLLIANELGMKYEWTGFKADT